MSYMVEDFYVGQRVRIRDWYDMMSEFGGHDGVYVSTPDVLFIEGMEPLCGMTAEITEMSDAFRCGNTPGCYVANVQLRIWEDKYGEPVVPTVDTCFLYNTSMLEPLSFKWGTRYNRDLVETKFDQDLFNQMIGVNE